MHALIPGMAVGDEPGDLIRRQRARRMSVAVYLAFCKYNNSAMKRHK
jgi:hypothetical protein